MPKIVCRRCGKLLPLGSLKYIINIHVTTDFDGYISEEEFNEEVPLEELVKLIKEKPPKQAENDVTNNMAFFLCNDCKNYFVTHPVGPEKERDPEDSDLIH